MYNGSRHFVGLFILLLLSLRFILLWFYPLNESIEGRHVDVALIMYKTGNWITPQIDYDIPFWDKPPLNTWLTILSYSFLGVSDFSTRLPHFISGIVVLVLIYRFADRFLSKEKALLSCLILTTSVGFILFIGMIVTDVILLFASTLAMTSFWKAWSEPDKKLSGYLFFVALVIGVLTKGSIALFLIFFPIIFWGWTFKCLYKAIDFLPLGTGSIVFILLSAPWYIMAEIETPGFFRYYFWQESFQHFFAHDWQNDLFGISSGYARGAIWIFWCLLAFPWSVVLILQSCKWLNYWSQNKAGMVLQDNKDHVLNYYLFFWTVSPMLLFSLSGNISSVYALPSLSAMSLLVTQIVQWRKYTLVYTLVSFFLFGTLLFFLVLIQSVDRSELSLFYGFENIKR